MKIKNILLTVCIFGLTLLSGCDTINSLDTFPLNIPVNIDISVAGNYTNITKSGNICLDESDTYKKYEDKIKSITFVEAAFRTKFVTPSTLSGHVSLTLADGSGNLLFSKDFGTITPANYTSTPYVLPLTQQEINAINTYLSVTGNRCFTAAVTVSDMPGGTSQSIEISIDMVFLSETEF